MKKKYQVTLTCTTNQYKPVSCIINREQIVDTDLTTDKVAKASIIADGVQKICGSRGWGKRDLAQYNYTRVKVRLYDEEKIKQENEERYNKIKEEKYASGEWKRP